MKVEDRAMNVTSTLTGEKIGMTLDQDATAHLMSVLTDLYSDPELAVIREYSTNAFDSHIEAGVTRPIEVTLPTPLSPFFRVRDYGIGMDADDIRNIYSRYGTSTKRNSNDVVGMLGLGCKSALTYTDQFTITGIRNGVMTQVSVSRDADGSGSMTIVAQQNTDQPNGVEVIVPSKVGNRFEKKAEEFFRFWEPGCALVNGKPTTKIDGMWISKDLLLTNDIDKSFIVMGNVGYPIDDYEFSGRYFKSVSFVEIGTVSFTPSRESLQMTTRTKQALQHLKERIQREKDAAMQKKIDLATTRCEAIKNYNEAARLGFSKDATWKGHKIPVKSEIDPDPLAGKTWLVLDRFGYGGKKGSRYNSVYLTNEIDSHWITDFPSDHMSPYKRQKLDIYLEQNNLSAVRRLIITNQDKIKNSDWLDQAKIHTWDDVEAIVVPKEKRIHRSDGRPTGSYTGWVCGIGSNTILAADIDISRPLFYEHSAAGSGALTYLFKKHPDATFIKLPFNRIDKFKRDFPEAVECTVECNRLGTEWTKKITTTQALALTIRTGRNYTFISNLNPSKLDDPKLKELVSAAKMDVASLQNEYQFLRHFGATYKTVENVIQTNYPLLAEASLMVLNDKKASAHVYLYVNAVYAAEMEV